jgi:hypothetical protein
MADSERKMKSIDKDQMYRFYFNDPISQRIERTLNTVKIEYFYFDNKIKVKSKHNQVICGCLLLGRASLLYEGFLYDLNQFDLFFLPPEAEILIEKKAESPNIGKICLCYSPIEKEVAAKFELQPFDPSKFQPRGEFGSKSKMATYRTVWTAIMNGYFMAGFTNIPNEVLTQGVITSVNLEELKEGDKQIFPHIHPEFPECYIFCIDDENYAITQYLINENGESICSDLTDGEGLFFPGWLGHSNFARPTTKTLKFCQYLWIIPTFGKSQKVVPITLKV